MNVTSTRIEEAHTRVSAVVRKTPLQLHAALSKKYKANVYLKREDLQAVRSYKLRGAYNRMAQFSDDERKRGAVCASAGNHAQGFAYSCHALGIHGVVFMPKGASKQKVERVRDFGDTYITIQLFGDTFDDAFAAATRYAEERGSVFVHPFNDSEVIAGQGTIAIEMLDQMGGARVDYIVMPIGGGGLASGIGTYVHAKSPHTQLIGVEPSGAASMKASFDAGRIVSLDAMDTFADGVAVRRVGAVTYQICRKLLSDIIIVPEGKVCGTMIDLYQKDGIVTEASGALSVSALDAMAKKIEGKTVICVISGGNNDLNRYPEVVARYHAYLPSNVNESNISIISV